MGPDLVVASALSLQLFDRSRKGQEPVVVQALGPEVAVEGFYEGAICRLPANATPSAPSFKMKAYWAPENADALMVFRFFPTREISEENSDVP